MNATDKKKAQIKKLALKMLKESFDKQKAKVDRALNSSAIDIDAWDENSNPMLIPKAIVVAILIDEADQHNCAGTSFEKEVKKNVKQIGYHL